MHEGVLTEGPLMDYIFHDTKDICQRRVSRQHKTKSKLSPYFKTCCCLALFIQCNKHHHTFYFCSFFLSKRIQEGDAILHWNTWPVTRQQCSCMVAQLPSKQPAIVTHSMQQLRLRWSVRLFTVRVQVATCKKVTIIAVPGFQQLRTLVCSGCVMTSPMTSSSLEQWLTFSTCS